MRTLTLTLALFAIPALAVAQQAVTDDADPAPVVELQRSMEAAPAPAQTVAEDATDADAQDVDVETRAVADDAAMQAGDPTQARWWWLVGAIVVGGILLAVLL